MKKFLSVLLALSVAFTFTFGSCMSAFAANGTHYTMDEQKALLAAAYNAAIADASAYKVDYDSNTYGAAPKDDITTFEISKDSVIAGIDAAYEAALALIAHSTNSLEDAVTVTGDYDPAAPTSSTDLINVKKYLNTQATTTNVAVVEKASWDAYKAALTALVDSVDISAYTETVKDSDYTAKDGKGYNTAAKAAAADIAYAKNLIKNAKYAATMGTASAVVEYDATYAGLYAAIFGASKVIKIQQNTDDPINTSLVTSLTYKLVGEYATKKSEENEAANAEVTKASAKAALTAAITTFENANTLKADAQAQLDAYKEAKIYLIENATTYAATYAIDACANDGVTVTENGSSVAKKDYVALTTSAATVKADVATKKAYYEARGYQWDDAEAAKALKTQLLAIYGGAAATAFDPTGCYTSDLTAGAKAAYKIDYSEIEAATASGYHGKVYSYGGEAYYEAEWTAVKAAIDTYNAAVDAAKVTTDITGAKGAQAALNTALAAITPADDIYAAVSGATSTVTSLETYAGLAYTNAHAADATVTSIYVTFGETTDKVSSPADLTDEAVFLWMIAQGAKDAKAAAALYGEACKIIDAYKTLKDQKAEAAAVQAQIAAVGTDKAAVVAAYDAYVALHADAKNYVTNYTKLTDAIKAVEKTEAYAVKAQITALPAEAKVAAADKAAIEAAQKAYNEYKDTTAYAVVSPKTLTAPGYDFANALVNVKKAAKADIETAYAALENKYVADKLTAEDAAAVKALEAAIAAYIADYNEAPNATVENGLAKIAAVVEAAKPAYTDVNAKAYILDMKVTAAAKKVTKTKAKMTVKADVTELTDNGYTVTYKYAVKAPGSKKYVTKKSNSTKKSYTFAKLKKGKNTFKVTITVKNAEGKTVGTKTKTKTYTRK